MTLWPRCYTNSRGTRLILKSTHYHVLWWMAPFPVQSSSNTKDYEHNGILAGGVPPYCSFRSQGKRFLVYHTLLSSLTLYYVFLFLSVPLFPLCLFLTLHWFDVPTIWTTSASVRFDMIRTVLKIRAGVKEHADVSQAPRAVSSSEHDPICNHQLREPDAFKSQRGVYQRADQSHSLVITSKWC